MKEGVPLRHGWGGDRKRRDQVLRDRQEEELERKKFPEKFGEEEVPKKKRRLKE